MMYSPAIYQVAREWGKWPHEIAHAPARQIVGMMAFHQWEAKKREEEEKERERKRKHDEAQAKAKRSQQTRLNDPRARRI